MFIFYFLKLINLFIFGLHWVFIAVHGLSLVAGASLHCSVRASHCGGFSCCRAWALGTRASVVVAHGSSCSAACGIFPDQGSNPCPLHWQADSQRLRHQGSPTKLFLKKGRESYPGLLVFPPRVRIAILKHSRSALFILTAWHDVCIKM